MSDNEDEPTEKQLKMVLVGQPGVGKTNIATRYCTEEFTKHYYPTPGVDFFLKRIILQKIRNVTLHIWDVGGQSYSGSMLDKYIFGAEVIILVYDVTNEVSFESLCQWIETVRDITKTQDKQPMLVIVGNKCDLEHLRTVKPERAQKFALENNLTVHYMSARTGEAVALSFQKITAECLGLRLTRSQLEEFQPIVRAEIVTQSDSGSKSNGKPLVAPSNSSVCIVQ